VGRYSSYSHSYDLVPYPPLSHAKNEINEHEQEEKKKRRKRFGGEYFSQASTPQTIKNINCHPAAMTFQEW